MNQIPQRDLHSEPVHPDLVHPDTDQLNAFVELSCPSTSVSRVVLAHIAACSRCRQVIYLAQEAASETGQAVPALVAAPPPSVHRQSWLTNRGMGWVALASAAAFAIAIFIHYRQTGSNTQRAVLQPCGQGSTFAARILAPASQLHSIESQPEGFELGVSFA